MRYAGLKRGPQVAVMESPPARALELDPEQPCYGGTVFFDSEGVGGCWRCGWRGVPLILDGVISSECPSCEWASVNGATWIGGYLRPWTDLTTRELEVALMDRAGQDWARIVEAGGTIPRLPKPQPRSATKVARNAPCPCGSGRKAKKCCHA